LGEDFFEGIFSRVEMPKIITIDSDLCTGCRSCEMVCSLVHEDALSPLLSRISVARWGEVSAYVPIVCQNCEEPVCETACPTKARRRDPETGAMISDEEVCVGCKSCLYACPFGAPSINHRSGKAMTCDLCDGNPQCILVCQPQALRFIGAERASWEKKERTAASLAGIRAGWRWSGPGPIQ